MSVIPCLLIDCIHNKTFLIEAVFYDIGGLIRLSCYLYAVKLLCAYIWFICKLIPCIQLDCYIICSGESACKLVFCIRKPFIKAPCLRIVKASCCGCMYNNVFRYITARLYFFIIIRNHCLIRNCIIHAFFKVCNGVVFQCKLCCISYAFCVCSIYIHISVNRIKPSRTVC